MQITRHYAQQTTSLEALAHPALDALMRNCNSTNLERVRKIKTQHQRLQGRLQGLREVMERYMGEWPCAAGQSSLCLLVCRCLSVCLCMLLRLEHTRPGCSFCADAT